MPTGAVPDTPTGRRIRLGAAAGMAAPVLFVAVFTLEGWIRPGYQVQSMFVSELSLGPRGWIQIVSFLLTGALLFTFGRCLARSMRDGTASRAGPLLIQIIGLSLLASGPFRTDPSAMFDQTTTHGIVHALLGAVVFSLAPVSCFVFYRRFRTDPAWRPSAGWTLATGIVLTLGVIVLKISQSPQNELFAFKGIVQRVILITYMTWLFALSLRVYRRASFSRPRPASTCPERSGGNPPCPA